MAQVSSKLRSWSGDGRSGFLFWCPGCEDLHIVRIGPDGWSYNGNPDAPTFQPSVLVRGGHFMPNADGTMPARCWCTFKAEGGQTNFSCMQCHSFVTDGMIQFLGDCSHGLAGKTVQLPDVPLEHRDPALR
jgi:hypothetical protein